MEPNGKDESLLEHICSEVLPFERNLRRRRKKGGIHSVLRVLTGNFGVADYTRSIGYNGSTVEVPMFVIHRPLRQYSRKEIAQMIMQYYESIEEDRKKYYFRIHLHNDYFAVEGIPKGIKIRL